MIISDTSTVRQHSQALPPVLTPRELQVLSHIVNGDQYGQIANMLGVSGETIKMHVRNTLRKFNARRISECMPEAINYVKAFGRQHDNLDTYMLNCDIAVTISDNFNISRRITEVDFVCMKTNLTSLEWQLRNSGSLCNATINGAAPTEITQYENSYVFKTSFENPVKLGERFKVNVDYTFDNCAVDEGAHKVITLPTQRVSINVQFDKSSIPTRIWSVKGIPHMQTEPITKGFQATSSQASLVHETPTRGEVVGIVWQR